MGKLEKIGALVDFVARAVRRIESPVIQSVSYTDAPDAQIPWALSGNQIYLVRLLLL
jgi:hypothetical protein